MPALGRRCAYALLITLCALTPLSPRSVVAAPLAHGTLVVNQATGYAGGAALTTTKQSVIIVVRTSSEIQFLRYVPQTSTAHALPLHITDYSSSATSNGPFIQLPVPQAIDLSRPVPLVPSEFFHVGETLFVELVDADQNLHTDQIETVIVTLTATTGDIEILRLYETGENTGIFSGYIATEAVNVNPGNGLLEVVQEGQITARYTDSTDQTDLTATSSLFDPIGTVFDSTSGMPVNGVTITIIDMATGQPAKVYGDDGVSIYPSTVVSGGTANDSSGRLYTFPPGGYRFPLMPAGVYRLNLTPPSGWTAPSTVATTELQSLPGSPWAILDPGSRGEPFTLDPVSILRLDIPVDPVASKLWIEKSAARNVVAIGDFVPYTIKVTNATTQESAQGVTITDHLPRGFRYRQGSAKVDGIKVANPKISGDGRTLRFIIDQIDPQQYRTISYVIEVVAGARPGKAVNSASAKTAAGTTSNTAEATVKVREDLFRSNTVIVGQVLDDCSAGAQGIPGVRIYLEDGSFVITDKDGLYHFEGVKPVAHVVQLDTITLPEGYSPVACEDNTRFAGQPFSQFVELQGGTLWRADFYAGKLTINPEETLPPVVSDLGMQALPLPPGATRLNLTSTIHDRQVHYQIEINNEIVAISNLKLTLKLPAALSPLPGSTRIDDLPAANPTMTEEQYLIDLSELPAGGRHLITFDVEIPQGAAGEMVATARLHFDTTSHTELSTPEAVNRFTVTRTANSDYKDFLMSTHFDSGLAELTKTDQETLANFALAIGDWAIDRIEVIGHTDNVRLSPRAARRFRDNLGLSTARAATVAGALAAGTGLPMEKISSIGKGESEPIADNRRATGRAANRRVEIRIWLSKERIETAIDPLLMESGPQQVTTEAAVLQMAAPQVLTLPEVETANSATTAPHQEKTVGILSPADGSLLITSMATVRVRLDSRLKPQLFLDGQEIPAERIGFTMADPKSGKTLYSFIGVDFGNKGDHLLTIHGKDAFGNTRFEENVTIIRTGDPTALKLIDSGNNVADGKSPVRMRLALLDDEGHPIKAGTVLEFFSEALQAPEQDSSLGTSLRDGKFIQMDADGWIEFAPVTRSGPYRVSFKVGEHTVTAETYVKPLLRDWILVGIGEGTVGYNRLSGNIESLTDADIEDSYYDDGRIAFFAKGKIKGDWLLTAAYDTAKEKQDKLHGSIDPDQFYMLYGDGSDQQYDAASARKLYIKLERDQFYALFGDYDTGLTVTELARYSRSFNGFKSELQSRFFSYNLFASETTQAFVRDEIPGDGTSGLYHLSRRELLLNSEKVVIETRDRFHSEVVTKSVPLNRHVDYDIDYDDGTLYFKEPVTSRDENFDPIFIVIDYETMDTRNAAMNYGGRFAARLGEAVEIGASHLHEGASNAEGNLNAIDTTVTLGQTRIHAELASSQIETGANTSTQGDAYLAEVTHQDKTFDARFYLREQESGFGLGQQRSSEEGSRKIGSNLRYRLHDGFTIIGELARQSMLDTGAERDLGEIEINYQEKSYTLRSGLRQTTDRTAGNDINRSTQLLFGGTWQTSKRLSLRLNHEQSLFSQNDSADYPTRTLLGADYLLSEQVSLFAEQEFTHSNAQDTDMSRAGIKATPWSGAQLQSAIEQQGSENGERVFATTGIKQTWQINESWSADAGLDRSLTLRHPGAVTINDAAPPASGNREDFTALSIGANRKTEKWSWSNRAEYRLSDSEEKIGLFSGAEGEVRKGLALSARFQLFNIHHDTAADERNGDLRLGAAWRPLQSRWIILDRLDYLFEKDADGDFSRHNERIVNNLNANYRPHRRAQISLQYGAKYVRETIDGQDYSGYTDLPGIEGRFDITRTWDIGVHASALHSWSSKQFDYSAGPSVGYHVMKNAWLSVGYNLIGFQDRDFSAVDFTAQGPFVKFRFKFDQSSVREALQTF